MSEKVRVEFDKLPDQEESIVGQIIAASLNNNYALNGGEPIEGSGGQIAYAYEEIKDLSGLSGDLVGSSAIDQLIATDQPTGREKYHPELPLPRVDKSDQQRALDQFVDQLGSPYGKPNWLVRYVYDIKLSLSRSLVLIPNESFWPGPNNNGNLREQMQVYRGDEDTYIEIFWQDVSRNPPRGTDLYERWRNRPLNGHWRLENPKLTLRYLPSIHASIDAQLVAGIDTNMPSGFSREENDKPRGSFRLRNPINLSNGGGQPDPAIYKIRSGSLDFFWDGFGDW